MLHKETATCGMRARFQPFTDVMIIALAAGIVLAALVLLSWRVMGLLFAEIVLD